MKNINMLNMNNNNSRIQKKKKKYLSPMIDMFL